MKSKSGKEIIINDVNLDYTFYNEDKDKEKGFCLSWNSNIGYGQMTFIHSKDNDKIDVETEAMSDNNDKEFIKLVLDKFIEKLNVIE